MENKKILIVEDDNFLANAYRVKFAKAGFDVHIARDGKDTLDSLNTFLPNLIILDLIMPVMDGYLVLEEIKKNELWKNIPIIVASNLGQKEDAERAMKLGANDFIVKSDLHLEDLIVKINKLLEQPQINSSTSKSSVL